MDIDSSGNIYTGTRLQKFAATPCKIGRMNTKRVGLAAVLFTVCGTFAAGAPQDSVKTIWDGAYTEAQAERGKAQYVQHCAPCHSESLQGGDEAPGLVGEGFLASWIDLPVGDLFERTRISMPQDRPGQLSRSQYADILAYLFRVNKFPAGGTELPADLAALKQIVIAAKPQQ